MDRLRAKIRAWSLFFMAGLVISGATAVPIQSGVCTAADAGGI